MDNIIFGKKIEEHSYEELMKLVNNSNPMFGQLAIAELLRRALDGLDKSIKTFDQSSTDQSKKVVSLTRWIVILTIVMLIGLFVQIILVL